MSGMNSVKYLHGCLDNMDMDTRDKLISRIRSIFFFRTKHLRNNTIHSFRNTRLHYDHGAATLKKYDQLEDEIIKVVEDVFR